MSAEQQSAHILQAGLIKLGMTVDEEKLLGYLNILNKWNHTYNLSAIRDLPSMVSRHILDSLAISNFLQGKQILDVGSGAGLPGIPLAIKFPDLHIVLLDSNGKKTRFLQEVKRQLALNNILIVQLRAENYHPPVCFDTVISRAFSNLNQMINWTKHLLSPQGIWLAMKGRYPDEELISLTFPYQVHHYQVPNIDGERCAVLIENTIKE